LEIAWTSVSLGQTFDIAHSGIMKFGRILPPLFKKVAEASLVTSDR